MKPYFKIKGGGGYLHAAKRKENHYGNYFQGKLDSLERQLVCYNN